MTQNYISPNAKISGAHNLVAAGRPIVKSSIVICGDYGVLIHARQYYQFSKGIVLMPCIVPILSKSPPLVIAIVIVDVVAVESSARYK